MTKSLYNLFERNSCEVLAEKIDNRIKNLSEILHSELYCSSVTQTKIKFEEGFVKDAIQKKSSGIGLRLIGKEGKEGLTWTSDISEKAIDFIITNGVKMMKVATSNPDFKNIAIPSKKYEQVDGIFDPKVESITLEDINENISPIFHLKSKDLPPKALSGGFSATLGVNYINNSNGVDQWETSTSISVSSEVSLVQDGVTGSGFDWQVMCRLKELNVQEVAANSYEMAKKGLKKASIETGKYPVLLSPLAVSSFIIDPLTSAINAESIQNNMSFLTSHLNQEIGSSLMNITDNPHLHGKISSGASDAEGIATQPLKIVDNGILSELYHNTFTAGKENRESNGHGSRGGFNSRIGISSHNIVMEPGKISLNDIIGDIEKGIYFEYTGDSPNGITGDFSGLIMVGYIIENGKIGPAVQETMIGINLLDAYSRISKISAEQKWVDDHHVPWILLDDVSISSR
jgi:PmbA protein